MESRGAGVAGRSIAFAGCARDCAPFLPGVLANLEQLAQAAARSAFVFAENGSRDSTRADLQRWLGERADAHLLHPDGADSRSPERTVRIAAARNACLAAIESGPRRDFAFLVMLDFDEVNQAPIALDGLRAALDFLEESPDRAAVFACSAPRYYDVWALRHPDWCPGDVWQEVTSSGDGSYAARVERFVHARQREIAAEAPPIPVLSAFGGLGIYRLAATRGLRYCGLDDAGRACCEHVAFNAAVARAGALHIFPALRNCAPRGHLRP